MRRLGRRHTRASIRLAAIIDFIRTKGPQGPKPRVRMARASIYPLLGVALLLNTHPLLDVALLSPEGSLISA